MLYDLRDLLASPVPLRSSKAACPPTDASAAPHLEMHFERCPDQPIRPAFAANCSLLTHRHKDLTCRRGCIVWGTHMALVSTCLRLLGTKVLRRHLARSSSLLPGKGEMPSQLCIHVLLITTDLQS